MATLVERLGRPEFRPGKLAEFKLRARNKFPSLKSFSGTDEMFRDVANNNTRTRDALHRESQSTAMLVVLDLLQRYMPVNSIQIKNGHI